MYILNKMSHFLSMNASNVPVSNTAVADKELPCKCMQQGKRRKRRASYKSILGKALKPSSRKLDAQRSVMSIEPTGMFPKMERI